VTSGAAAGRYARALFDVVLKEQPHDLDAVDAQLHDLASLFTGNAAIAGVMGNPAVPVTKKVAVVNALLDRSGSLATPVAKLVRLLAERDRLMLLSNLARAYRDRLMDHQQVIRGDVTTAAPLAPEKVTALAASLERATGRKVVLETRVDPSIIGGVVTRLGSTVYDGSLTTQLAKLKQSLIGAGQ